MLAAVLIGSLVVGLPVAAIFGDEAGAMAGLLTGLVLYMGAGSCPHCGKGMKLFAEACPHCGRAK